MQLCTAFFIPSVIWLLKGVFMEFLFLLSGLIIGVTCTYLVWKSTTSTVITKEQYLDLDKEKCLIADRYKIIKEQLANLQATYKEKELGEFELRAKIAQYQTEQKNWQDRLQAERARQEELHQQYTNQFENLAQRLIQRNAHQLTDMNEEKLNTVLGPLHQKLQSFENRIEATHQEHTVGSKLLQQEVHRLAKLNHQISEDARNLTQALKGNNKTQGLWGEVVLERILDHSGLQKGQEFFTQGAGMKLRNEEGVAQRPDVIVMLPEKKHIIIDAKVSLKAYEAYINSDNELLQRQQLKQHLHSLKGHVNNLSAKYYQKLDQLHSLDFVLMFLPVEGSLSAALQSDQQDLLSYAWERKVIMVTPTTLLATLKTIAFLWRNEKQHRNALQIAKEGGRIYDKLCGLITDLNQLGKGLNQSQRMFQLSMNKLANGKGNLISRAKKLRELGAETHKQLPSEPSYR